MSRHKPVSAGYLTAGGALTFDVMVQHDACAVCGQSFVGTRSQLYCTEPCAAVGRRVALERANERRRRRKNAAREQESS